MGSRRHALTLVATLLALTACTGRPGGVPTGASPTRKPVKAAASAGVTPPAREKPGLVPGLGVGLDPSLVKRAVPATGPVVTLTGKVKLLSDMGSGIIAGNTAGIISNNAGTLISDHGGNLISDHGSGLVANNSAGLTGKTKYALAQEAAPPAGAAREFLLADAEVTVHDAAGRLLVDERGAPIAARSDGQGGYKIEGRLPAENLVLRTKLWNGGELSAILPKADAKDREVAIDTAATLGATYVLGKFVKGDQQTFDKLPASEAERLRRELEAARGLIARTPDYRADALVALTDDLRKQAPTVDKALADIEVLLLGGLGDGKPADRVALNQPRTLFVGPDGTLYIGESSFGRVRAVSPDGLLTTLMDGTGGKIAMNVPDLIDMALAQDGTLYCVSEDGERVWKVPASGPATQFVGGGQQPAADGRKGTELDVEPASVAPDAAGTLYVGLYGGGGLLAVAQDGTARVVATPAWGTTFDIVALVAEPDGALLALTHDGKRGRLARRAQDGTWTELLTGLEVGTGDVGRGPDGTIWVVEENGKRVTRLAPDGTRHVAVAAPLPEKPDYVPPPSEPGAPTVVTPCAVAVGPDGTLYLADRRTNLVHARTPAGAWRLAAGATGDVAATDGFLPFNGPAGVAFDAEGRMLVAESTGHGVKRFDGKTLTTVAGGVKGEAGDGGPAVDARFDTPGAIAFKGQDLLVADGRNFRIRAIGPDGVVRPFIGRDGVTDESPLAPGVPRPALEHYIKGGCSIVVGPDGLVYFIGSGNHQIARLRADGQVELVAGRPYGEDEKPEDAGDGGDPTQASLTAPLGMAFDRQGDLWVADTGNMRLRKITGLAPGGTPRIDAAAGLSRVDTIVKLFGLQPGWEAAESGIAATSALTVGPAALCFDDAGNLYLTEGGTTNIAALTFQGDSIGDATGFDIKLLPPVAPRVRKITPDGRIFTIGGTGAPLFDPAKGDGLGLPTGIAIDPQGRLVVVDARENAIRLVPKGGY